MRVIIEDISNPEVGSIVFLKWGTFWKDPGDDMIQNKHMFLVTDLDPITVSPISSNMSHVSEEFPFHVPINSPIFRKSSYVNLGTEGIIDSYDIYKIIGNISIESLRNVLNQLPSAPKEVTLESRVN